MSDKNFQIQISQSLQFGFNQIEIQRQIAEELDDEFIAVQSLEINPTP